MFLVCVFLIKEKTMALFPDYIMGPSLAGIKHNILIYEWIKGTEGKEQSKFLDWSVNLKISSGYIFYQKRVDARRKK